jgi:Rrf2 family nitric oxide-sensitive transcriptional repressor
MQLTRFSDYSLRVLLYLAAHRDRTVSIREISRAYGISEHHLVKVVQLLVSDGLVASTRGRGGGLRLNREPAAINVGAVVRLTEPNMALVECFDLERNTCPIEPACGLKNTLQQAQRAFLAVLDQHTLADSLPRAPRLIALWKRAAESGTLDDDRPPRCA